MYPFYAELKIVQFDVWSYTKPKTGSFSNTIIDSGNLKVDKWIYCREKYHDAKPTKIILFYHKKGKSYNVASFLNKCESDLKLKKYSLFGPTQRPNITWIQISPWWLKSSIKKSLLTCLFRAGQIYDPLLDNFEECLDSTEYTLDTKFAIKWFLKGNTKYLGNCKGWHRQFKWGGGDWYNPKPIDNNKIKKLLIKSRT